MAAPVFCGAGGRANGDGDRGHCFAPSCLGNACNKAQSDTAIATCSSIGDAGPEVGTGLDEVGLVQLRAHQLLLNFEYNNLNDRYYPTNGTHHMIRFKYMTVIDLDMELEPDDPDAPVHLELRAPASVSPSFINQWIIPVSERFNLNLGQLYLAYLPFGWIIPAMKESIYNMGGRDYLLGFGASVGFISPIGPLSVSVGKDVHGHGLR